MTSPRGMRPVVTGPLGRPASLYFSLFNNFGSAIGAKVAGLLLGIVTYSVLARTVGTAGLGRYRTVLTLLLFAGVLFDFGLYSITLRDISRPRADEHRILGNAVALRIAATSCAILLLVLGLLAAGVSATGVMIAGVGWVALQLSELLRAVFQLKLAQPRGALAEVVGAAATLVLVVGFAALHAGTDSMLAATAAGFCCTAAVSWRFASGLVPFRLRFEWPVWRALILAGLPIGASLIFQTVQLRVDVVFLALLRSPAELGLYDAPLKLYELLFAMPLLFGGLMLPWYVRDVGTRAGGSLAPRLNAALGVSFIFSMLTFAVLLECAGPIVVTFAGPGFSGSADPLRILAGSAIFAGVTGTLRFAAVAIDEQRRVLRADIIGMCAAVAAHAILIPRYGIIGAAFGKLCGDIVTSVSAAIIMRKVLSRTTLVMVTVAAAAAACLIGAVSFAVNIDVPWFVASGVCAPLILGAILLVPRVRQMLAPLAAS